MILIVPIVPIDRGNGVIVLAAMIPLNAQPGACRQQAV